GVRLCKAARYRYKNNNMEDLEAQLKAASEKNTRFKIIVTDGVFSMDGIVANLKGICDLADQYNALVMVDDSHATGFIGKTGRGTHEANDVIGRIDIITSTLGKALGGALGGFTSGKKEIIDMLRQRSRPYLFSNSLAPGIVGAATKVLEMITKDTSLRDKVMSNADYFRKEMKAKGFDIPDGDAAIVPVMLYDAKLSQQMADKLMDEGVYVIGFFYPVVPKDKARIRVQLSAAHTKEHLDKTIAAFEKVGKELGVI
ncbi:MAG: glycine C-acetyltransferase, partial [Pseudopedobacter saltans]